MKRHTAAIALVLAATTPVAACAAEGAAAGNGTSTLAGPAGDNSGPSMSTGSSGSMTKSQPYGSPPGTTDSKSTATGGQPGSASDRN